MYAALVISFGNINHSLSVFQYLNTFEVISDSVTGQGLVQKRVVLLKFYLLVII